MSEDRNITPMPVPTAVRDRAIVTAPIAGSIPPWRRQQSWLRLKAAAGQPVSDDRAVWILDPFSIERARIAALPATRAAVARVRASEGVA